MADVLIEEKHLSDIADAIRGKVGSEDTYKPREMAAAIEGIEGADPDCNGLHIPPEALEISGSCDYMFYGSSLNWLLEQFGEKIATKDITGANNMFMTNKGIEEIPFDVNFKAGTNVSANYMFGSCSNLKTIGKIVNLCPSSLGNIFSGCDRLRQLPDFVNLDMSYVYKTSYANCTSPFKSCYSLRAVPEDLLKVLYTPLATSTSYVPLNAMFQDCYALDEVRGINPQTGAISSNMLSNTFKNCYRLKDIIFAMQEDGTPYKCNWKNQTIDLTGNVGYVSGSTYIINYVTSNYNSGITDDKKVSDDAAYQALKNDPDWFAANTTTSGNEGMPYSRYNKLSAINTINSLPDVTQGSGNSIKFKGAAGSKTDGGAIQDLDETTIALAASKGWTITFA